MGNAINQLQRILENLGTCWKKYGPRGSNGEELLDKAYKTLLMCRIYLFTSFVTYLALTALPFINFCFQYLNGETTNGTYDFSKWMILMKYPFEIQSVSIYFLVTFIEENFLLITATFWTSGDCLFATVTTQICIQFDVLKCDIQHLSMGDVINKHQELLK
ncbi:uncharacterized protein LOC116415756 [Nasonia vitripennis]|uniref:Uncharacterized protein n=1 Tax=Nasonia vitripennis TaxID=7425 RepID=A0A7M7PYV2_NASVI|nr:uncharacterized protein LOC116415756 [Nasonia vitripennis]XP_031776768.1 uncharacterized protein LOC116415756 [Nasonia vitripennis]